MPKDPEKAKEWLEEYLANLREYEGPRDFDFPGQEDALLSWLHRNEARVLAVVGDLVSNQIWVEVDGSLDWIISQRSMIERALGVLAHEEDLAQHWSGDSIIDLDADALHPWVWNAAKDLWASDHWGEALEAGVKVLQVKLQDKVERPDLSGVDLVRQSFGLEAPKGRQIRLRVMGNTRAESFRSAQEGAMHLGEAVLMYWRNPLSHTPGGSPRQLALEGLAAASTLARLIETSTPEQASEDT